MWSLVFMSLLPDSQIKLRLPTELKQKIEAWDNQYQSIYVDD